MVLRAMRVSEMMKRLVFVSFSFTVLEESRVTGLNCLSAQRNSGELRVWTVGRHVGHWVGEGGDTSKLQITEASGPAAVCCPRDRTAGGIRCEEQGLRNLSQAQHAP